MASKIKRYIELEQLAEILKDGAALPARARLNFTGDVTITDDEENEQTVLAFNVISARLQTVIGNALAIPRRLRYSDLDPDLALSGWHLVSRTDSGDSGLGGGDIFSADSSESTTYLVRRGATLSALNAQLSYDGPHAIPNEIIVADVVANGATLAITDWAFDGAYETASPSDSAQSVTLTGTDSGPDPTWTSTAHAHVSIEATNLQASVDWTSNSVSFTVTATSDVYLGKSNYNVWKGPGGSPPGFYLVDDGGMQGGFSSHLSQSRTIPTQSITLADQYLVITAPNRAAYAPSIPPGVSGGPPGLVLAPAGTSSVHRNGVTQTYKAWVSTMKYTGTYSVSVTA